jgi:hypothetical protein
VKAAASTANSLSTQRAKPSSQNEKDPSLQKTFVYDGDEPELQVGLRREHRPCTGHRREPRLCTGGSEEGSSSAGVGARRRGG